MQKKVITARDVMQEKHLEIALNKRLLRLMDYDHKTKIIIFDEQKHQPIPPYFVAKKNNQLKVSAYYSRLDLKHDEEQRAKDWCAIISKLK